MTRDTTSICRADRARRRQTNGHHGYYAELSRLLAAFVAAGSEAGFGDDWWPNNARERRVRRAR
jgi:hypothetical protein